MIPVPQAAEQAWTWVTVYFLIIELNRKAVWEHFSSRTMLSFPHAPANTHVFSAQIQHTSIPVQEHTSSFQNSTVSSAKRLFFFCFFLNYWRFSFLSQRLTTNPNHSISHDQCYWSLHSMWWWSRSQMFVAGEEEEVGMKDQSSEQILPLFSPRWPTLF